MNLPFWPFKQLRDLKALLVAENEAYLFAAFERDNLRRDLAAAEAKLVAQDAAFLVVQAIHEAARGVSEDAATNAELTHAALNKIAHAVGAVATAQDKASNVQREWLEVSKGNR